MATALYILKELETWLQATFQRRQLIQIHGGFREAKHSDHATLPLLELNGVNAETVRLLLPPRATVRLPNTKLGAAEFYTNGEGWWNTWATVLAATALLPPRVDARSLQPLLHENRRIKFCCDTNALCSGAAIWLLHVLNYHADIVTSTIVDRELEAWHHRFKGRMWQAQDMETWDYRTQYRIARRLTETPPRGVVMDRLSPEQGALMLAKLRDETERKSPDADMLLIELARGLLRDQPGNARVVYLTGDHSNVRAAMNALGVENVLFVAKDHHQAREAQGKTVARGWWNPHGPLGAVLSPPTSELLWYLLAACHFLILETNEGKWRIQQKLSVRNGVPSDWVDPRLEVTELSRVPANTKNGKTSKPTTQDLASVTAISQPDTVTSQKEEATQVSAPTVSNEPSDTWLLAPITVGPPFAVGKGWRPTPSIFFALLWKAISGQESAEMPTFSKETQQEVLKILVALEVTDSMGNPSTHFSEYHDAWVANNLDWFHAQLKRLPGYDNALEVVREGAEAILTERQKPQVGMARKLGQVARITSGGGLIVGDAPVRASELRSALEKWLPKQGDTLPVEEVCRRAGQELALTPVRFERAVVQLWRVQPDIPIEGRTGGTVTSTPTEEIIELSANGYTMRPVAPGALTFGRSGPVRFLVRTR